MGIKSKMMKAAPKLASRPTRSQRRKDALASKAGALALGEAMPTRSQRKKDALASKVGALREAMPKRWRREGLAATLRRRPTAGTRGRPSPRDAIPAGIPRKRSR